MEPNNKQNLKGYFLCGISDSNFDKKGYSGVGKKIVAQINAFSKYSIVILDNHGCGISSEPSLLMKVYTRLPFTPVSGKWEYKKEYEAADFFYLRRPSFLDYSIVKLFRKIKKNNLDAKILLELPTYPYAQELLKQRFIKEVCYVCKDYVNGRLLKGLVDRIVTFSPDSSIWGIPTVRIKNGVDFSRISLPSRKQSSDIHLIEVSSVNFWHGYDRLLEGLGRYYQNGGTRNIVFHVVGDGMVIPQFREIVSKYAIESHVVFHGTLGGDALDEVFKMSYIGVDALGRHRSNNPTNSSLKSREYVAYGLPFIAAVPIDFAGKDWPYVMYVPQDESPIDMNEVIKFYDSIYSNNDCNKVASDIRNYAEFRCDMKITMQPVIDYILSEKE